MMTEASMRVDLKLTNASDSSINFKFEICRETVVSSVDRNEFEFQNL